MSMISRFSVQSCPPSSSLLILLYMSPTVRPTRLVRPNRDVIISATKRARSTRQRIEDFLQLLRQLRVQEGLLGLLVLQQPGQDRQSHQGRRTTRHGGTAQGEEEQVGVLDGVESCFLDGCLNNALKIAARTNEIC